MAEFVDRDALAKQRHEMAAAHRVLFQFGDIDRDQIHRNAACDRAALAGDDDLRAACAVIAAAGAEITVGVTGGEDSKPGRAASRPVPAIADAFAAFDIADLYDARLQIDDR